MEYIVLGIMVTAAVIAVVGLIMYVAQELMITWKDLPGGHCPVQAEGWFLGYYFYFRSRYERATIEFSKTEKDWYDGYITKKYLLYMSREVYAAGYISHKKAKRLIYWGCFKFLINRIFKNLIQ